MSADNFYLIRAAGDRFAVTGESASAADVPDDYSSLDAAIVELTATTPIDAPNVRWFDTLEQASDYAFGEYSEYGVQIADGDHAGDTYMARVAKVAALLVGDDPERFEYSMWSNPRDRPDTVELSLDGGVSVTITGASRDEARRFARWLELTSPSRLAGRG